MQISCFRSAQKGGFEAAFFSIIAALLWIAQPLCAKPKDADTTVQLYVEQARQKDLAYAPQWAALLHADRGGFHIRSAKFLLTASEPTLERELNATIDWLLSGDATAVCRYPARYLWLREEIGLPELSFDSCTELQEFYQRAPADQIDLVFAAENITQASSMMGHVFLKLSSPTNDGQVIEHAVSFFTDAAGYNLPKLFFDSMVVGKKGYFSLSPYSEKLQLYLGEEQRSVWEYQLQFTPSQRRLIQAHLMELKQAELTYFFQKYNCATLLDFVLAVGAGKFSEHPGFWVTPKDVVKRAQEMGLILANRVRLPNQWLLRAHLQGLTPQELDSIERSVPRHHVLTFTEHDSPERQAHILQLAEIYSAYLGDRSGKKSSDDIQYQLALRQARAQGPKSEFLIEERSNPTMSPQDSQWNLGYTKKGDQDYLQFVINPASHHLSDDNRGYMSESDLRVFELSLRSKLQKPRLEFDRLTVYSSQLLMPYDRLTESWSSAVLVELARQDQMPQSSRLRWQLGAGRGVTLRFHKDLDVAVMVNAGLSDRNEQWRFYLQPQATLIMRGLYDTKAIVSVSQIRSLAQTQLAQSRLQWEQVKYFDGQKWSLHFVWQDDRYAKFSQKRWSIALRHLF